jgi:hypothetical protein
MRRLNVKRAAASALALALVASAGVANAQMADRVFSVLQNTPGRSSAIIYNMTDYRPGDTLWHDADRRCGSASTIKAFILYGMLRLRDKGQLDFNKRINVWTQYGNNQGDRLRAYQAYSIHQLVEHMMSVSNNWATNRLIDHLGGIRKTNDLIHQDGYFWGVQLQRYMLGPGSPSSRRSDESNENWTTARHMWELMAYPSLLSAQARNDFLYYMGLDGNGSPNDSKGLIASSAFSAANLKPLIYNKDGSNSGSPWAIRSEMGLFRQYRWVATPDGEGYYGLLREIPYGVCIDRFADNAANVNAVQSSMRSIGQIIAQEFGF